MSTISSIARGLVHARGGRLHLLRAARVAARGGLLHGSLLLLALVHGPRLGCFLFSSTEIITLMKYEEILTNSINLSSFVIFRKKLEQHIRVSGFL